jgi:hypothetical protein
MWEQVQSFFDGKIKAMGVQVGASNSFLSRIAS